MVYKEPTLFIFEPRFGYAACLCCVPQYFNELSPNIEDCDIEPNIPIPHQPISILPIILFLIKKLSRMKMTIIATKDIGNGGITG